MEVLGALQPLNQFLCDLHGPTDNLSRTIGRLVPLPTEVWSLPDADVLDLSVSIQTTEHSWASVSASGRYATSARLGQATTFYRDELERCGAQAVSVETSPTGSRVTITACFPTGDEHVITIDQRRGYRSVRASVDFELLEARSFIDRFAFWHEGKAPISFLDNPTGFEISSFARGRGPSTLGLYTTHYACDLMPLAVRRKMVDERLAELGWTYREPRQGILFMRGCEFPAETHVIGDDQSSVVTFVGEFELR